MNIAVIAETGKGAEEWRKRLDLPRDVEAIGKTFLASRMPGFRFDVIYLFWWEQIDWDTFTFLKRYLNPGGIILECGIDGRA